MHADAQSMTAGTEQAHDGHGAPPCPAAVRAPVSCGVRARTRPSRRVRRHGTRTRRIGCIQLRRRRRRQCRRTRPHAGRTASTPNTSATARSTPLMDWLVFEVLGVFVGGFLSGILAGRFKKEIARGPSISAPGRLVYAFVGGGILGFGAKLARGCMSGQALTGGALLNVGSWAAMMCIFAGAYAMAYFVRRQWL